MRTAITILLTIGAFLILGWVMRPLWDNARVIQAEITRVNEILSGLEEKKQFQQELIQTYNSISDENLDRLLSQHLPDKPDTGMLLMALEEIASRNNVVINSISFQDGPKTGSGQTKVRGRGNVQAPGSAQTELAGVQELLFSFAISASYADFKKFLSDLESHVRLIDVTSIAFGAGQKETANISLVAKAYYRQ